MAKNNKNIIFDWKQYPKRNWPYKGDIEDPEYLKDRAELFHDTKNILAPFNGWWWFTPNKIHKYKKMQRNRIRKRRK